MASHEYTLAAVSTVFAHYYKSNDKYTIHRCYCKTNIMVIYYGFFNNKYSLIRVRLYLLDHAEQRYFLSCNVKVI